jgi:hypothetical protein
MNVFSEQRFGVINRFYKRHFCAYSVCPEKEVIINVREMNFMIETHLLGTWMVYDRISQFSLDSRFWLKTCSELNLLKFDGKEQ